MRLPRVERGAFLAALVAVFAVGLASITLVPFYEPFWGLDFQNIHAFRSCPEAASLGIYAVSGAVCGDELARAFAYPPSLYHAFFWVDWFSFSLSVRIWNVVMVVVMAGVGVVWLWLAGLVRRGRPTIVLVAVWAALLVQYPFVFALERGNNDVLVVAMWTAAAALSTHRFVVTGGAFAGAAVALKVYPAIAAAIAAVAMLRRGVASFVRFGVGALVGVLALSVLWWDETFAYVTDVLPDFAGRTTSQTIFSHVIGLLPGDTWLAELPFGSGRAVPYLLAGALLLSWITAAWRRSADRLLFVLAGALAISTYFSATSWDYNLVTTYPLLLLAVARSLEGSSSTAWRTATVLAVFSIASGRGFFTPEGQIIVQVAALTWMAWLVVTDGGSGSPRVAERHSSSGSER